jgi:hypothetical protein
MIMDYHSILGFLAVIIGIVSYIPYLRDCFKGKTKPNLFTWIVWGIITGVVFFAQIVSGAGAGAWILGVTLIIDIIIVFFALKNSKNQLNLIDSICFILALIAIIIWAVTSVALYAILLLIIADALGFFITFKKTYVRPFEETLSTYAFSAVKHFLSFLALESVTPTTVLYPLYLVIVNVIFVIFIQHMRKSKKII